MLSHLQTIKEGQINKALISKIPNKNLNLTIISKKLLEL